MMNGAHYDDAEDAYPECPDCETNVPVDATDDEPTELADRHEGATATREQIQATFEYEVALTEAQIDDLPGNMNAAEFAENIATSRMNKELDPTFRISPSDAIASEVEQPGLSGLEVREFTVFVRVSQND